MITVISGTNRQGSETEGVARRIHRKLKEQGQDTQLLNLVDLPVDLLRPDMYKIEHVSPEIIAIQDAFLLPADKFWFVFPEYNGSLPGSLKLFIDAVSVRKLRETFHGKKACLTGVSTGRAGNLRGMDHLTSILNYLQVLVHPNKLPISSILQLKNGQGEVDDPETLKVLDQQIDEFAKF